MIVDQIRRAELPNHNLGSVVPPSLPSQRLVEYKKDLELIWDADDSRWNIYKVTKGVTPSEDLLSHQVSLPYQGTDIPAGFIAWLQMKDYSEGGKLDKEQREKKWVAQFKSIQTKDAIRKRKAKAEQSERLHDICDYLKRLAFGGARVAVPAGPPVGINKQTGKLVRAYKKKDKLSEHMGETPGKLICGP